MANRIPRSHPDFGDEDEGKKLQKLHLLAIAAWHPNPTPYPEGMNAHAHQYPGSLSLAAFGMRSDAALSAVVEATYKVCG